MTTIRVSTLAVLVALAATFPDQTFAQAIPGTAELCARVEYRDEIGSRVDSLHVVLQEGPDYDERRSPQFPARGLKSAPGYRPVPDSLVVLLPIDDHELVMIRSHRVGERFVGAVGFPQRWHEAHPLTLQLVQCPWW